MANEYYDPGNERAPKVRQLFDQIAPRYDLINDLQSFGLHRYWKRRLLHLSGAQPGVRAVDVCCGTGDIALALARRGSQVSALDFSEAMLAQARRRSAARPELALEFFQGDAMRLPFAAHSFDVATMGYGLRNLASGEQGVRELCRVVRPGGKILILDFGKPEWLPWQRVYFGYLAFCVPIFGWLFCRNASAYAYILESLRHYPAQQGVDRWLRASGCVNTRIIRFLGGVMTINYAETPGPPTAIAAPTQ